jgi:hypothetical protein
MTRIKTLKEKEKDPQRCEKCFFWMRLAHELSFELGQCNLLELQKFESQTCDLFDPLLAIPEKPKLQVVR